VELDRVLAAAPEGETQDGGEPAAGEDEGDLAALVGDLKRLGSSKESGPAPARGSSEELRMLKEKKRRPAAH
ncbi:MAG: hypothetical protein OEY28_07370, partial [Nitrospira sp.]|nr:hypothetical protein [Nitrospira sp.]